MTCFVIWHQWLDAGPPMRGPIETTTFSQMGGFYLPRSEWFRYIQTPQVCSRCGATRILESQEKVPGAYHLWPDVKDEV